MNQSLKVEDALWYLERVKMQFGSQPHVYNQFLNIMKDFKTKSIDTPGVIKRVSHLFRGHPQLIVGFNTFLPPGYKIDLDGAKVSIFAPTGESQFYLNDPNPYQQSPSGPQPSGPAGPAPAQPPPPQNSPPFAHVAAHHVIESEGGGAQQQQQQQLLGRMPGLLHLETPPNAAPPGGQPQPQQQQQRMPSVVMPPGLRGNSAPVSSLPDCIAQLQEDRFRGSVQPLSGPSPGQTPIAHQPPTLPVPGILPAVRAATLAAAQAANVPQPQQHVTIPSQIPPQPPLAQSGAQANPEVNQAITYVNKIKMRFLNQPETYKEFLEILHTYQKQQKNLKEGFPIVPGQKVLSESDVYHQVATLFKGHEDLFVEFQRFLPEAVTTAGNPDVMEEAVITQQTQSTAHALPPSHSLLVPGQAAHPSATNDHEAAPRKVGLPVPVVSTTAGDGERKRTPKRSASPAPLVDEGRTKKHRPSRHGEEREPLPAIVVETQKHASPDELTVFDQIKRALKSDEVYTNFLRLLTMYESNLMTKSELIHMTSNTFLSKFPELMTKLKEIMKCTGFDGYTESVPSASVRPQIRSDLALEIDYATCKQCGTSYRKLPKTYTQPVCSGRTSLCDEVLNDKWVSFPSWSSEDTTSVAAKKTPYEEQLYKIEDERFELDIIIELNRATIKVLESTWEMLKEMPTADQQRFKLDDGIGGRSATLHQKVVRILYGDRACIIIEGLKNAPLKAIPVVLKRLRQKDDEWTDAQREFNRVWREQMERSHLKSLDLQAGTFKQSDQKLLRSKSLVNQIEQMYSERQELLEAGKAVPAGPHLQVEFPSDPTVFYDAMDLVIYHARRQPSMGQEEKAGVKKLLRHSLPDLFDLERCELSDDEEEDESSQDSSGRSSRLRMRKSKRQPTPQIGEKKIKPYSLLLAPNAWYIFLRLYALLCERLDALRAKAIALETEEATRDADEAAPSAAVLLRLRNKKEVPTSEYYPALLEQIRNLLDGQVDQSQYEDSLREMFTIHAYVAFTMDKLIQGIVRQLQIMVSEVKCKGCQRLHDQFRRDSDEEAYQRAAEQLLQSQNCFKIYFFREPRRVTFELLNTDSEEDTESDEKEPGSKSSASGRRKKKDKDFDDKGASDWEGGTPNQSDGGPPPSKAPRKSGRHRQSSAGQKAEHRASSPTSKLPGSSDSQTDSAATTDAEGKSHVKPVVTSEAPKITPQGPSVSSSTESVQGSSAKSIKTELIDKSVDKQTEPMDTTPASAVVQQDAPTSSAQTTLVQLQTPDDVKAMATKGDMAEPSGEGSSAVNPPMMLESMECRKNNEAKRAEGSEGIDVKSVDELSETRREDGEAGDLELKPPQTSISLPTCIQEYVSGDVPTLLDIVGYTSHMSPLFLKRNLKKLRAQLTAYVQRHEEEAESAPEDLHRRVWIGQVEQIAFRDTEAAVFQSASTRVGPRFAQAEGSGFFLCRPGRLNSLEKMKASTREVRRSKFANLRCSHPTPSFIEDGIDLTKLKIDR